MFSVSVSNREPIYTQLEKNIIRYINLGVYEKNSMLPSVRALACELGINPNTVSKAYKNLEANGVVYTVAGKGVFVKGDSMLTNIHKMAADEIKNVLKDAKNKKKEKTEVISIINEVWDGDRND